MLYLAEVQRKSKVIGSGKAELRLLACQRSEHQWIPMQGEELIPAPDNANLNAGALVMVELSATKQVQQVTEAGRRLVTILQNFSRLQEKAKTQEEEIQQWRESLTYQSQELNRREMEMEARQEELQQMEEAAQRLEQQKTEVEAARQQIDSLREEFERKSQELEGAWAQLRGENIRLEEKQAELQQSCLLDDENARYLQDLLERLAGVVAPTESIQAQLNSAFELIAQQQDTLNGHWHNLEQHRETAQHRQSEVDQQTETIRHRWASWHEAQQALTHTQGTLQSQQDVLALKQGYAGTLKGHLDQQHALHHQVSLLAGASDRVDLSALEEMPLETLRATVTELDRELEKLSRFVHSQEEELTLQQEAVADLSKQMQQASEYDRMRFEAELADEQDRYHMLNQTLVGQRRNLLERQDILNQHKLVLARRQGIPLQDDPGAGIDLTPVLDQIDQLRQQLTQELQGVEEQIQHLQEAIAQTQGTLDRQTHEQQSQRQEIVALEEQLRATVAAVAELWGKVNTYQDALQPMQDCINGLKQKAESIASDMTQFQEASHYQRQAITEMKETVHRLTGAEQVQEMAA